MAGLELRSVTKRFGSVAAVDSLSIEIRPGEIVALLGPSGSGKTTALRLLAGFEAPDAGQVVVRGQVVADAGRGVWVPPERRGVGMVFQDLALFPHLTVTQNVAFGLHGRGGVERAERIARVLALSEVDGLAARYPHELSGGQQQRVALARALAASPDIVLLDEPFAALDADLRQRIRADVRRILSAAGATAVLVTHDQEEALTTADRVAVIRAGRLEQVDAPDRLYHAPATRFVATFLGQTLFVPGRVHGGKVETEIGSFSSEGVSDGGVVEVMLRPEDVLLAPEPTGEAAVVDREFRGSQLLYTLRLPSGRLVRSLRPSWERHDVGARVQPFLRPRAFVLFAGETAILS